MLGASLRQYVYPIFFELQNVIRSMASWVSTFVSSMFSSSGALRPLRDLFFIGLAVGVIVFVFFLIRRVVKF